MVNTFLIDPDFRESARKLDRTRLGKQRVEAYQILIVLRQLRFLARQYNLPDFPVDQDRSVDEREKWIELVLTTFRQAQCAFHIRSELIIEIPFGLPRPHRIKSGHQILLDNQGQAYEVKGKRQAVVTSGSWFDFVLPGEELIHNPRRHPAIRMWLGFETALMDYINAHIEIWLERGYVNNMTIYEVPKDYQRPVWSYSDQIMDEFRSALVQRELERQEPLWYSLQPDCVQAFVRGELEQQSFQSILSLDPTTVDVHASLLQLGPGRFPDYSWP